MPAAIAKAEGLDRAAIKDTAVSVRFGSESTYALRFRGRGSVTGRVVLADGVTPAVGAAVNLYPDVNSRELGRGLFADSAGRFAFHGVPLGPFTLDAANSQGLSRLVADQLAATAQTKDLQVVLSGTPVAVAPWQGRVTEADGSPVAGASVYVGQFDNGKLAVFGQTTANELGYYALEGIPVGSLTALACPRDSARR